jgi:hypothetical protein
MAALPAVRETEDGIYLGDSNDKVGFHGTAPSLQRAGAAQAAIGAATYAAPNNGTPDSGDATTDTVIGSIRTQLIALAADVATHKTLVNELRAALVAKGLIKGAA